MSKSFIQDPAFTTQALEKFSTLNVQSKFNERTLTIDLANYLPLLNWLKTDERLKFEQLIDLCGADYSEYPSAHHLENVANTALDPENATIAVVLHLLSVTHNQRVRVRVYMSEQLLSLPTVTPLWSSANWYEREAFDLYGIQFIGHDDLRRILTDYDFIGHPLRKSFPVSGFVEMRYDDEQARVIYQPVTIEPREITPRILRESNYAK